MQISTSVSSTIRAAAVIIWAIWSLFLAFVLARFTYLAFFLPLIALALGLTGQLPITNVRSEIFMRSRAYYLKGLACGVVLFLTPLIVLINLSSRRSLQEVDPNTQRANERLSELAKRPLYSQLGISTQEVVKAFGIPLPLKPRGSTDQYFKTPNLYGQTPDGRIIVDFMGIPDNLSHLGIAMRLGVSNGPSNEPATEPTLRFVQNFIGEEASDWIIAQYNEFIAQQKEQMTVEKQVGNKSVTLRAFYSQDQKLPMNVTLFIAPP
jgi:hypothetical protein